jgi:hypothetical protein
LNFKTAGTDMVINQQGNVGIGTTSPGAKLHVDAPNTAQIELTGNLHGASNQTALVTFSDAADNNLDLKTTYAAGTAGFITLSPG